MSIMVLTWLVPVGLAVVLLVVATGRALFLKPRTYAEAAAGLLIASLPFTLVTPFTVVTKIVLIVLQLMLLLLVARMLFGRLDTRFAYPSTRGNAFVIFGLILVICSGWWLAVQLPGILGGYDWRWAGVMCAVLAIQALFFVQLIWTFRHYRLKFTGTKRTLKELPTVSICIPARNEDHALEDCLVSALSSNYPKLEVIVLDDCSQDNTSQIVRSFAHDGVRFIKGDTPASGWLGKNQAMQTLSQHATGEYILFIDVDTLLTTTSLSQLVNYALDNKAQMVAVQPQNRLGLRLGTLFGTMRDFWQLALPISRWHMPVAEPCWLIQASALKKMGGFKSVAKNIVPTTTFARQLFAGKAYRFIAGGGVLGITTAKRWTSEAESALRILYPTYKRQPVLALAAVLAVGLLYGAPFGLLAWLIVAGQYGALFVVTVAACVLAHVNYALVLQRSHPRVWLLAVPLLPFVALQEVILTVVSMLKYEFGEVNWKGRNVCYPVILLGQNRPEAPVSLERHR